MEFIMMDVIEITLNEFKEDIYAKYIRLFPKDEQRDWKKQKELIKMELRSSIKFY